jgi:PiT family inorganic phosphate transporter
MINVILDIVVAFVVFLAVALVAGNNLSACAGPVIGARILTKRRGALLGIAGFTTGLLVQGSSMTHAIGVLLPNGTVQLQVEALLVATAIFMIAHLVRVPISLSMSLVGFLAGLSVARGLSTNLPFVAEVAVMWVVAPVCAALLAFYLIRIINRREVKDIWHRIRFYKSLLILLSFTTAYVSGANTLGLIVATGGFKVATIIAGVTGIIVGSIFLGEGTIRRMSQEFYMMRYSNATITLGASTILIEVAAILHIPLSATQTTAASVLGTGLSYKAKFVSLKPFLTIVLGWIIAPLLSFMIGWILYFIRV